MNYVNPAGLNGLSKIYVVLFVVYEFARNT